MRETVDEVHSAVNRVDDPSSFPQKLALAAQRDGLLTDETKREKKHYSQFS